MWPWKGLDLGPHFQALEKSLECWLWTHATHVAFVGLNPASLCGTECVAIARSKETCELLAVSRKGRTTVAEVKKMEKR